jgi:hypothetical protein
METAAMRVTRDRFRVAVSAWRAMPVGLRAAFLSSLRAANRGAPGPWLTAWTAYSLGAQWSFNYVPRPTAVLDILGISDAGAFWAITCSSLLPPGFLSAHVLCFHPINGLSPEKLWHSVGITDTFVALPKITVLPGSSVLLFPHVLHAEDQVGLGDAFPLP